MNRRPSHRTLRRVFAALLMAALVAGGGPHGTEPDSTPPAELSRYQIDLRLDMAAELVHGHATITSPELVGPDGVARLDPSVAAGASMIIERVTVDGADAGWGVADDGTVQIPFDGKAGTSLSVEYRSSIRGFAWRPFGYLIFEGISGWAYPRLVDDQGRQSPFADFTVTLDHPASMAVLTTGGPGEADVENGRRRARYHAEHVTNFAIVAGEGYRVERDDADGAPLVAFYHPDHEERYAFVIERAREAAAWYTETYGFFPLEEIGIIQGHPRWGGGYPLPNMFAVHLGLLEDEFLTWITAHELGHYYWGFTVLNALGNLDWLLLALGIWSDQYYLADRYGRSLAEQWRDSHRQGDWFADYLEAIVANHEQRLGLPQREAAALRFDYHSLVRHGKAATGIYLLSQWLGPERFLDLQRRLLREYRFAPLSPKDFVHHLEGAGLPEAGEFISAWQRGDATIGLTVKSVTRDPQGESWAVALRRTGPVPYPVEVEIATRGSESSRHVVGADVWSDTARTTSRPERVRIDPDGLIPMMSSSHVGVRALHVSALGRAGLDEQFLPLARAYLEEVPDDDFVRQQLIQRLFTIGAYDEVFRLWSYQTPTCGSRDACRAAIYAARALHHLGRSDEAHALLESIRESAERHGEGSTWAAAWSESVEGPG